MDLRFDRLKILTLGVIIFALFARTASAVCVYYTGNEYVCLSSDTKPATVSDGARAYESDTRRHFLKVSGAWQQVPQPLSTTDSPTFGGEILRPATYTSDGLIIHLKSNVTAIQFYGGGLNDLSKQGTYTAGVQKNISIVIDGTGTPDTFKWSKDGGNTYPNFGVAMTGDWQDLESGLQIKFTATTGHTLDDEWYFEAMPHSGELVKVLDPAGNEVQSVVLSGNGLNLNTNTEKDIDVCIGKNAGKDSEGYNNVFIGKNTGSLCRLTSANVFVGEGITGSASGSYNIHIGNNITSEDTIQQEDSIAIGADISVGQWDMVVGGPLNVIIKQAYFGQGKTGPGGSKPFGITFNATGASGSNIEGGDFTIAGGKSTGDASGGNISFKTSPIGAAGSDQNALVERGRINAQGRWFQSAPASAPTDADLFNGSFSAWLDEALGTLKVRMRKSDGNYLSGALSQNEAGAANNFLTAYNSTTGAFSKAQPGFSDISGTVTDGQLANNYSGTGTCTNQFPRTLNDNAAPTCATVGIADVAAGGTTPDNTKFWRGDGTWQVVTGGSGYSTIQNEGTPLTQRTTLNFTGTGVDCADDTTRTSCTINTGGTDLSAEPFVTSSTSTNLSAERVLTAGTNTTIDTATAGQIKVNLSGTHADSFHADSYSGVGACGANTWASTLNDNAAPTCTQPAFSNISGTVTDSQLANNYSGTGSCTNQFARVLNDNAAPTCAGVGVNDFTANQGTTTQVLHGNAAGQPSWGGIVTADLPTIDISKGGTTETASTEDAVLVGASTTDWVPKVLPSCSNGTTSKLLYDNSTNTFSCGTDQTSGGGPISAKLTSDYTNNTTTGTNVSALNVTLAAGTYRFSYFLVSQTAATGTGIDFGVNFTGTQTLIVADLMYPDTGTSATAGTADGTVTGDGAELLMGRGSVLTASTTVPNLNVITGVATANENFTARVEGTIVVTVSGDLQLYAATDVASSQVTIKAGSNLLVTSF